MACGQALDGGLWTGLGWWPVNISLGWWLMDKPWKVACRQVLLQGRLLGRLAMEKGECWILDGKGWWRELDTKW